MHEELRALYDAFVAAPFPLDSRDPVVSALHAELVEYDAWIAGLVSSFLQTRTLPAAIELSGESLQRRLREAAQASSGGRQDALNYLRYFGLIEQLVRALPRA